MKPTKSMIESPRRKIALSKETVKALNAEELTQAVGGDFPGITRVNSCGCTFSTNIGRTIL